MCPVVHEAKPRTPFPKSGNMPDPSELHFTNKIIKNWFMSPTNIWLSLRTKSLGINQNADKSRE